MRIPLAVIVSGLLAALWATAWTGTVWGQSLESFYTGRQIKLVVGTGVGGGSDLYSRFLARHFARHIPGQPMIIVVNIPGATSIKAADYIANVAPRDGSEILNIVQALPLVQAFGGENIRFDLADFAWIGNMSGSANVLFVWNTGPVKTIADARTTETLLGSTTPDSLSGMMPLVFNNILGTRFRVINGYKSGGDINLAIERGEVGGRGSDTWAGLRSERPDWVRERKIAILLQAGLRREPDLPEVPMLVDLARNDDERRVLAFFADMAAFARAYAVAPGVPADRVAALRRAFDETMQDPALLAEAERQRIDISPLSGVELQDVVRSVVHADAALVARAKAAVNPEGGARK